MDRNILFVTSDQARATGKDLVSFHKSFRLVFNADVIAHTGIKKGWWAEILSVDKDKRTIEIVFNEEKKIRIIVRSVIRFSQRFLSTLL